MVFGWKLALAIGTVAAVPLLRLLLMPRRKMYKVAENGDIVLLDLAQPLLPVKYRMINLLLGPFLYQSVPTVESVVRIAMKETGLADFGDEDKFPFQEGLNKFLEDVEREYPKLTLVGKISILKRTSQVLENRLRIVDVVKQHPEILQEKIEDPVFIVGPPRSGTTHWHNTLAQHKAFKALRLYELGCPVMSPDTEEALQKGEHDSRWEAHTVVLMVLHRHYSSVSDSSFISIGEQRLKII